VGHVKLIKSGQQVEIYEYENDVNAEKLRCARKNARKRGTRPRAYIGRRRLRNVAQSRKSFTRLVLSNLGGETKPWFFTFTMYEVVPLRRGYWAFTVFIERLRKNLGRDFSYIAVPEFQKRGAVHFHVLFWRLREDVLKNERDNRYIQNLWGYGYCDGIPTDGSPRLAGYFAKYMSKAMLDHRLGGEKAYSASRNIMRPVSVSFRSALAHTKEMWGLDLSTTTPLREAQYETKYLGKGRYRLYNLKQ